MEYTENQKKYISSVDGEAHMSAVEIIGDLEEKFRVELAIERRALELACNKLFREGVIIEEDTDAPAIDRTLNVSAKGRN